MDIIKEKCTEELLELQDELMEQLSRKLTPDEIISLGVLLEVSHELTKREDI